MSNSSSCPVSSACSSGSVSSVCSSGCVGSVCSSGSVCPVGSYGSSGSGPNTPEHFSEKLAELRKEKTTTAILLLNPQDAAHEMQLEQRMAQLEDMERKVERVLQCLDAEHNLPKKDTLNSRNNNTAEYSNTKINIASIPQFNRGYIEEYFEELQIALSLMDTPKNKYVEALKLGLKDPILRKMVEDLGAVTFEEAKVALINFLVGPKGCAEREKELEDLLPISGQSVRHFAAEFMRLAERAVNDPNSNHVLNLLTKRIPVPFQQAVIGERAKKTDFKLRNMVDLISALEANGLSGTYPKVVTPPPKPESALAAPITTAPPPPRKFCTFHQSGTHSTEECNSKPANFSAPQQTPTALAPETQRNNRTDNRRAFRVALVEEASGDMPMLVNGVPMWGIVDSGAEISMISGEMAKLANCPVQEGRITVELAIPGFKVELTRFCTPDIQKGSITCQSKLWIVDQAAFGVLLGRDLLPKLGLAITGMSVTFPSSLSHESHERPSDRLSTIEELPSEKEEELSRDREEIINSVQQEMARNRRIPEDASCSNPRAIITIPTSEHKPVFKRQPPIPRAYKALVDQKIQELLHKNIIELADESCGYAHPLVVVPKKIEDGTVTSVRVCIDPRLLNPLIESPAYEIPLIEDILSEFAGCQFITTLDLADGYHQLPLLEEHKPLTAFFWNNQRYQYTRCPFGLKHATAEFQRIMKNLIGDIEGTFIYVDDIVVVSRDADKHGISLKHVIQRLTDNKLRINFAKSKIAVSSCKLLGFVVSPEGVMPDEEKIRAIVEYPRPKTLKDLQRFLGMLNYLRKHIPNLAQLTTFETIRMSDQDLIWDEDAEREFMQAKKAVASAIQLVHPCFGEPFEVETDASDNGLGAVIYQKHGVIACYSRTLTKAEHNYSTNAKELLAILFALQKGRQILLGSRIKLHTDHKPLTYLMSQKVLTPTLAGWIDAISEFDLEVEYKPGSQNVVADALSRSNPHSSPRSICMVEVVDSTEDETNIDHARRIHETAHFAPKSIVAILKQQGLIWKGMNADCRRIVQSCENCAQYDELGVIHPPLKTIMANHPFAHVQVDLITNMPKDRGFAYIFVAVDLLSGYVWMKALRSKTAKTLTTTLKELFSTFGIPEVLQSDNGREFKNSSVQELCQSLMVEQRFSLPYSPQTNGRVERANRSIGDSLRRLAGPNGMKNWTTVIPQVQLMLNARPKEDGISPFQLVFLRLPKLLHTSNTALEEQSWLNEKVDVNQLWESVSEMQAAARIGHYKRRRSSAGELEVGTLVYALKRGSIQEKWHPKRSGPYTIASKDAAGHYELVECPGKFKIFELRPVQQIEGGEEC